MRADQPEWIDSRLRHVGDRIRAARLHAGLSQEQLAERVDCDRRTIQRIEAGRTDARLSRLLRIARALRMTLTDLLG